MCPRNDINTSEYTIHIKEIRRNYYAYTRNYCHHHSRDPDPGGDRQLYSDRAAVQSLRGGAPGRVPQRVGRGSALQAAVHRAGGEEGQPEGVGGGF